MRTLGGIFVRSCAGFRLGRKGRSRGSVSRILSSQGRRPTAPLSRGENHFSRPRIAPRLQHPTRDSKRCGSHLVSYLGLLLAEVYLFSLQQLPESLPFPTLGSMPWTFSLLHWSSGYKPCDSFPGRPLAAAISCGVRTFLEFDGPKSVPLAILRPALRTIYKEIKVGRREEKIRGRLGEHRRTPQPRSSDCLRAQPSKASFGCAPDRDHSHKPARRHSSSI